MLILFDKKLQKIAIKNTEKEAKNNIGARTHQN